MRPKINKTRASTLQRLYRLKILRAERRLSVQMEAVKAAENSYVAILQTVTALRTDLLDNREFRQRSDVCADPRKTVEALRYREHIEYNLERETYYLQMAEDELASQQAELTSRKRALQNVSAKNDATLRLIKRQRLQANEVGQDQLEEDTPAAKHTGAR